MKTMQYFCSEQAYEQTTLFMRRFIFYATINKQQ